ncbi:D-amino-acid dehydrogenase [Haloferula helveola]|uniref:D-amino-acid dehydrogenase n=1 Tax=Haloferula helveola TaxID=490095 RepID=A0ABN6H7H7_9BACT|nr:D-amino-acid dehydrogenase [Haloferula helveola]
MSKSNESVIVVGGGIIGLCSAYYALKSGLPVTVLEREPAGGDNCSLGNAGMVVPSHFIPLAAPGMIAKGLRWMFDRESPFYVRPRLSPELARWGWLFYRHSTERHVAASSEVLRDLNLESRRLFHELAEDGDFGLVSKGLLMLCETEKGLEGEAEVARQAVELGVEARVVDPAEAARLDPDIDMSIAGAVHFAQDCHLEPERLMALLRKRVIELGGTIEIGVEVERLETNGDRVVAAVSQGRRFEGGNFVITGGSWTGQLLRQLGTKLPLQAGKGYSLTLPDPPQLPRLCSIFTEAKVAITPMGGSLRFAGTMEVGGLDLSVDEARVRGIVKSVRRYFPKFSEADFEGVRPWAGLRPVSPDGVPYLGKVDGFDNTVAATGHAMMGLSLGPVSGRLVADLLTGREPFRPIDGLALGRFG